MKRQIIPRFIIIILIFLLLLAVSMIILVSSGYQYYKFEKLNLEKSSQVLNDYLSIILGVTTSLLLFYTLRAQYGFNASVEKDRIKSQEPLIKIKSIEYPDYKLIKNDFNNYCKVTLYNIGKPIIFTGTLKTDLTKLNSIYLKNYFYTIIETGIDFEIIFNFKKDGSNIQIMPGVDFNIYCQDMEKRNYKIYFSVITDKFYEEYFPELIKEQEFDQALKDIWPFYGFNE